MRLTRREFGAVTMALAAGAMAGEAQAAEEIEWLDEIQRPPAKLTVDGPRLRPLLVNERGERITTLDEWNTQRAVLRGRWTKFLGELTAKRRGAPKLTVLAEDRVDDVVRQRVAYEVEPGMATEAYLLRPAKAVEQKRPGVAVFHSTVDYSIHQPAGVKGEGAAREKAFGLQLAKMGFVTFCPRNFLWPKNDGIAAREEAEKFLRREPECKGMAKMLYDSLVAVDILAAQPDVDASRLGAVGHSLGAKEVLYLAAFDERIKATVSSEGGVGIGFSNWNDIWYLGPGVKQPGFELEHHELLALAAPRAFLLIGGDSADGAKSWPFIEAAMPVYKFYGERPRIGLWNHAMGHSVPPEAVKRIGQWCERYV